MDEEIRINKNQLEDEFNSYCQYCYQWVNDELKPAIKSLFEFEIDSLDWDNLATSLTYNLCYNCFFLNITPQQLHDRSLSTKELEQVTELLLQSLEENDCSIENNFPEMLIDFQNNHPELVYNLVRLLAQLYRMTYEETMHALRFTMIKELT